MQLNWDAPATRTDGTLLESAELASFDIYYFDDSTGTLQAVHISDPALRQWRITDLSKSNTYHFSVTTTDTEGNVSASSEAVSIEL